MNYEPFNTKYTIRNTRQPRLSRRSLWRSRILYTCRESSTNHLLFMQNKPNLVRRRRIANLYNTKDYENKCPWRVRKNKPNSNPIKPNLKRAQMNINSFLTKGYRKNDDFVVRINKPNFRKAQNERKLICYRGLQKKNDFAVQKNKPNLSRRSLWRSRIQTQFQTGPFFCKDIYWLPEHILSRNSSLAGYSLSSLKREYMASRVP